MHRLIYSMLAMSLVAFSVADAKPDRRALTPEKPPVQPVRNLTGIYACSYKGADPNSYVRMKIWNHVGNKFQVGIADPSGHASIDWEGHGVFDGDRGYYDWIFPDGKSGRTTFTVDKDGALHAQVRGGGIDWDYVGRPWEKPAAKKLR